MPFIGEQLRELIDNGGSGGGGSCVITDLGQQEGHAPAQSTILELLKPTSVPTGKYLYTYWNECNDDATLVICYKSEYDIYGTQITSQGQVRTFSYNFENDEENNVCLRNMGGTLYEAGNNISFDYQDEYVYINSPRPKLYAPTIKISGLTLTIKNPTKNKDLVGSYDIYNADTNAVIKNVKKTTVDLSSLNIADGTYNIAVKAKGVAFNGTTFYDDSDYSNTVEYTHDNPPTLKMGSGWYKGTTDKSTITEITFDNTYQVTGNETESWDASNASNRSVMCYLNGTSLTIKPIHPTNRVHTAPHCYFTFNGFQSLTTINNLTALDTSNATNMQAMFQNCKALTSLDLSNFDTSKVTDMSFMFYSCNDLTSLDLSSFDTSNVTSMTEMFRSCYALTTLDVSNFDTSKVTDMSFMFYSCNDLTSLDVSNFDTSNVTSMTEMFRSCKALTTLDLSNFDTSNVTDMASMFSSCNNLTLDCSSWNVDNVTSYAHFNLNAPNVTPPQWVN